MFGRKKEICCICSQNEGSKKILDGMICKDCISKCGIFFPILNSKNISSERVKQIMRINEINSENLNKFHVTDKCEKYIELDENNRLWKAPCYLPTAVFSYDDIVSYELLQDGQSVTKGGFGSAVIGGAVFGGVGAIVGSNIGSKKTTQEINEYRIKIVTNNICFPEVYINFLVSGKIKSNSILYKTYANNAQRILSLLSIITNNQKMTTESTTNVVDEIRKYKNLLDEGIITQEDFDAKKAQLLNL